MLTGMLWLLACQLVGQLVVDATGVPVPGPVVGMVLLLVVLVVRDPPDDSPVHRTADAVLPHLQLLFVPAGVGIVAYAGVLRDDLVAVLVALVGSWFLGLAVVGLLADRLGRRTRVVDAPDPGRAP
ncbi:MAG: CidA/LrgA family protein [Nocardioides marinisabuli]|uniref:CidA/LrgA family protein n=1 Tax=Nocardioides marinisabuli TaxID=419476 RepID=UPI00321C04B4